MPRTYDNCLAKCPFFESSTKKNIICEGIIDFSTLTTSFEKEDDRNFYKSSFCDKSFEKCAIYNILYSKY